MKQVLNTIFQFFEAMGQARAASVLARAGKMAEARAICGK